MEDRWALPSPGGGLTLLARPLGQTCPATTLHGQGRGAVLAPAVGQCEGGAVWEGLLRCMDRFASRPLIVRRARKVTE